MQKTSALIALTIIMLISIFVSLISGSASISLSKLLANDPVTVTILTELRLPRTIAAFTCGALLSLSGTFMQLLLRNPLADPYILGVSSGAALVTLTLMTLGVSELYLPLGSWVGSLSAMFIVFVMTKKGANAQALLLTGVALTSCLSALISFLLLVNPNHNLHHMLFWITGDLNGTSFPTTALIILIVGFIFSIGLAPGLNIYCRGEQEAKALGLHCERYQLLLYFLSALLTAATVSLIGSIGFIGLIIPHVARIFCGYDYRLLIPFSAFIGGCFLVNMDTLSRVCFAPEQIPIGIMMSLIGAPIFLLLLKKYA